MGNYFSLSYENEIVKAIRNKDLDALQHHIRNGQNFVYNEIPIIYYFVIYSPLYFFDEITEYSDLFDSFYPRKEIKKIVKDDKFVCWNDNQIYFSNVEKEGEICISLKNKEIVIFAKEMKNKLQKFSEKLDIVISTLENLI